MCCDWDKFLGNGKDGGLFCLFQELVKQGNRLGLAANRGIRFHPPITPVDAIFTKVPTEVITPKHIIPEVSILLVKAASYVLLISWSLDQSTLYCDGMGLFCEKMRILCVDPAYFLRAGQFS
jgi:hypothetical protein